MARVLGLGPRGREFESRIPEFVCVSLGLLGDKTILSCRELAISSKISSSDFLALCPGRAEKSDFFWLLNSHLENLLHLAGRFI